MFPQFLNVFIMPEEENSSSLCMPDTSCTEGQLQTYFKEHGGRLLGRKSQLIKRNALWSAIAFFSLKSRPSCRYKNKCTSPYNTFSRYTRLANTKLIAEILFLPFKPESHQSEKKLILWVENTFWASSRHIHALLYLLFGRSLRCSPVNVPKVPQCFPRFGNEAGQIHHLWVVIFPISIPQDLQQPLISTQK